VDVIGGDTDGDTHGLDLTPAAAPTPSGKPSRRRKWGPIVVIVLVLVAGGYVVSKALTSAALFFYTADEAVAKRPELGQKVFRIEGTVVDDVCRTPGGADFDITYNGVVVPVDHSGDPPQLFKAGQPVVLEGHWDPSRQALFDSNLILVKHDATYTAKNSSRISQADAAGKVSSQESSTTKAACAEPTGTP
jgi:cytochrome c-type biogenesis protein CcmE